ncbi:MAG: extracellular solute-binding protein [Chloroflexota bacterium]
MRDGAEIVGQGAPVTRRRVLAATRLAAVLPVLAGCDARQQGGSAAPKLTGQPVKLVVMTAQSQGAVDRDQKIADMLQEKQPQIEIEFEMPKADRHVEYPVRLAAGAAPDMVFLNNSFWRQYAKQGAFLKLDPFVRRDIRLDDYFPSFVQSATYRDSFYGWGALAGASVALFYNKDLFDQAGLKYPDETWAWPSFVDAAGRLTVDGQGRRAGGAGFDPQDIRVYGTATIVDWRWDMVIEEEAGDILRPGGTKSNLDSPDALAGLQWMSDTTGRGFWPSDRYPNEKKASFTAGNMAMQVQLSGYAQGAAEQITFQWDVAPLPRGKHGRFTFGWWAPILASASTKYPAECWEFIKVMGGPEGQRYYMVNNGWLPAIKKLVDEQVWLKDVPINKKVFYAGKADWRPAPGEKIVPSSEYSKLLSPALDKLWLGQASAKNAIGEVIDQINRLLLAENN